jgi:hypothetical protein
MQGVKLMQGGTHKMTAKISWLGQFTGMYSLVTCLLLLSSAVALPPPQGGGKGFFKSFSTADIKQGFQSSWHAITGKEKSTFLEQLHVEQGALNRGSLSAETLKPKFFTECTKEMFPYMQLYVKKNLNQIRDKQGRYEALTEAFVQAANEGIFMTRMS